MDMWHAVNPHMYRMRNDLEEWRGKLPLYALHLLYLIDKLEDTDPQSLAICEEQLFAGLSQRILTLDPDFPPRRLKRAIHDVLRAGAVRSVRGRARCVSPDGWIRTDDNTDLEQFAGVGVR